MAPVCKRCITAKRACFYLDSKQACAPTKFIVYSLPKEPGPSLQVSAQDRRILDHFNRRTIQHVQGPFQDEVWSKTIPQLVQNNGAVRNAAFALSAIHEYYLDQAPTKAFLAEYSLHHYQKALRQVIRLSSPGDSFDSILGVCVIACQIESLRGGFEAATRHAVAGMKMIADQRSSVVDSKTGLSEDDLSSIFSDLQYQVLEANADEFHINYPSLEEQVGPIPEAFKVVEEALPHLHTINMQLLNLFETAESYYKPSVWNWSTIPTDLIAEYDSTRANFEAWAGALSRTESIARGVTGQQLHGFLALKIFEATMRVDLDIFPRGEAAYDDFITQNHGILKLVEVFLLSQGCNTGMNHAPSHEVRSTSTSRYFTSSLGIVGLLFEIATRTADKTLRDEAARLLRIAKRREGIWDSDAALRLLERIEELEDRATAIRDDSDCDSKFVITEIKLLSDQKCLVTYGFKKIESGYFYSHWFENIQPGEGVVESVTLDIS